jgi:hypothetical protein
MRWHHTSGWNTFIFVDVHSCTYVCTVLDAETTSNECHFPFPLTLLSAPCNVLNIWRVELRRVLLTAGNGSGNTCVRRRFEDHLPVVRPLRGEDVAGPSDQLSVSGPHLLQSQHRILTSPKTRQNVVFRECHQMPTMCYQVILFSFGCQILSILSRNWFFRWDSWNYVFYGSGNILWRRQFVFFLYGYSMLQKCGSQYSTRL